MNIPKHKPKVWLWAISRASIAAFMAALYLTSWVMLWDLIEPYAKWLRDNSLFGYIGVVLLILFILQWKVFKPLFTVKKIKPHTKEEKVVEEITKASNQ